MIMAYLVIFGTTATPQIVGMALILATAIWFICYWYARKSQAFISPIRYAGKDEKILWFLFFMVIFMVSIPVIGDTIAMLGG